ncbi:MAG TPA: ATP-binding cassette domain-containing protein [Anaeromyxobacter sp.]|nr:ATP-binding cassette domain-containing protein [Anaeromyxobacter sp.]
MSAPDPGRPPPLLSLRGIEKWYGEVHALRGVTLQVARGEVLGLIGDNGAGKSTLIKVVSGVVRRDGGQVLWNGREVALRSVREAQALGIETVHQDRAVVGTLDVARNVFLGREPTRGIGLFRVLDRRRMARDAQALLRDLRLHIPSVHQEARFCSGGEMQGVAIARAMHYQASLVILDEPTTALAVTGVQTVLRFIRRLRQEGIACLFVTHNLHDVHAVADRFVVMARGAVVASLRREEASVDDLVRLQLGSEAAGRGPLPGTA